MPRPTSIGGRPERSRSSLYSRSRFTISHAKTQVRPTLSMASPSRSSSATLMASPSRKTLVARGGKNLVGMEAAFGHYFFDALRFFAEDKRVLELLRIHPRRIFGEQRNGFIGSNDVRENAFALQQAGPDVEAVFSIAIFRRQVFAVAGAHQHGCVFGNIERLLQVLIVNTIAVSQFAQKI